MKRFKLIVLSVLVLVSIIIWSALAHRSNPRLTFAMLDIGQGDALFIESPTGTQVLVDAGRDMSVLRELSKVMPFYDKSLDLIVVTNPDEDHFAGFIPLLERYRVGAVLEPGTVNEKNASYGRLEADIANRGIPRITAERGQKIDLGGGAYLLVLFPDRSVRKLDSNPGSIVMKLVYGDTSFMLTGDSVQGVEEYLVSLDGASLKSTVLKVGHHGSRTSTNPRFVQVVSPEYAFISAGVGNSYGHPHQETLDALAQAEVAVLGTYEKGSIITNTDGRILDFTFKP